MIGLYWRDAALVFRVLERGGVQDVVTHCVPYVEFERRGDWGLRVRGGGIAVGTR
jgi:hypothetical protein